MLRVLRMLPFSQAAIKVNSGSGDPKVSKGRSESPLVAPAGTIPPATIKIKYENVQGEGGKGATANFVRFHCPLIASAEAKSPACRKEQLCLKDQQFGRAHLARHSTVGRKSSLGARLRTRKVTGRDASLPAPFVERVWHNWSPVEQLGRCPKPHQRRRLWTPQGAIAP